MPKLDIRDKHVIITGAANGIGAALAHKLHSRGARLVLVDIDERRLTSLSNSLDGSQRHIFDMTTVDGLKALKKTIDAQGITPTGLMNCVGSTYSKPFADASHEEIDHILRLNLHAMVELCHLFLPGMLSQGEGYILNMSSTSAYIPCPEMVCYSATKAFINNFSQTLNIELSPRNVHVRFACPGAVDTDFFSTSGMDRLDYVKTVRKMQPDYVAERCLELFESRAPGGVIGLKNKINMLIARALPSPILDWVVARRFN